MKELLRESSFRTGSQAEKARRLMTQHHGGILEKMLNDEILSLRQSSGTLERTEGDKGSKQSLTDPSHSLPAPQVGGLEVQGAVCEFKRRDFRSQADTSRNQPAEGFKNFEL